MTGYKERKITKEQYERAQKNSGYLTESDMLTVFDDSERYGYGVYGGNVHESNGKYYVSYQLGSSCD